MTEHDPERLLDEADATARGRDLLRSALDADPPPGANAAIWAALTTRLPGIGGGAGGGGAASGGGAGAATGSTALKIIGSVALVALVAAGVRVATTSDRPPVPPASAPSTSIAAGSAQPSAVGPDVAPPGPPSVIASSEALPPRTVTGAPATALSSQRTRTAPPGTSAPSVARAAALREEAALLASAREALHGGDGRRALSLLDEARSKLPAGMLVQEREVVAIEALAQTGDKSAAARRAETFLRAFPGSPHAAHVRTFLVR